MSSKAFICLFVCISVAQSCALASPESEKSLNAGKIYAKQGKFQLAVTELRTAVDLDSNYADGWRLLGTCCMQMGKFDEAKAAYQKAANLSSGVDSISSSNPANSGVASAGASTKYDEVRKRYMYGLGVLIKRNWHPAEKDFTASVEIQFKVSKDGKLSCVQVRKSSGNEKIDQAALDAVLTTTTAGDLPPELGDEIDAIESFDHLAN